MKTSKIFALFAAVACAGLAVAAHAAGFNPADLLAPETLAGLSMVGAAGITTFKQEGVVLTLTPGAAVNSGTGYLFGAGLFGVAMNTTASGAAGEFLTEGVVSIGKTSALAISVGDRLFWDATNKVVNKTSTAQQCVGVAVDAAANPSATVAMKLGQYLPAAT
jgi:predicted RecA/RadA family phage recombinase